jgi:hypothetical protein
VKAEESGVIAPQFLTSALEGSGQHRAPAAFARRNSPRCHCLVGSVDSYAYLDVTETEKEIYCPYRESTPYSSAAQFSSPVAISTELFRPLRNFPIKREIRIKKLVKSKVRLRLIPHGFVIIFNHSILHRHSLSPRDSQLCDSTVIQKFLSFFL